MRAVLINLSPRVEQEQIAAEVERRLIVGEELSALGAANLQRATRLWQSILRQAFEGKLVQEPLNKESSCREYEMNRQ